MDKGFQIEMRTLDIICSVCNWNGQLREYEVGSNESCTIEQRRAHLLQ